MFIDDHKKTAMTILSKRKPSGEKISEAPMKVEKSMDEGGEVDGKHVAAQDILAAHHEGSAQKLAEAMSHFMDMHMAKGAGTPETK